MKWKKKSIALALLVVISFSVVFSDTIQMVVDKAGSYSEYLVNNGSGVSILGLLFVFMIGSSLFFHRHSRISFKISVILLIAIYVAKIKYPIFYRLAFVAQVFYLFYLTSDLKQKFLSREKIFVLWPIVGALFVVQAYSIATEKASLSSRVDAGDLGAESLDAGYLPYEFIWQNLKE